MPQPDPVLSGFNTRSDSITFPPRPALTPVADKPGLLDAERESLRRAVEAAVEQRHRVLKLRFIKEPATQRIVRCEVFDADTKDVVGQIFVSDVKLSYPANGGHPEALVRLISAWEDAYE